MNEDMHREHDLDLIADLVEERLSDPAPAEELVATCSQCAAAYRDHLLVRRTIDTAPHPRLNDLERRRLRDEVWESLDAGAGAGATAPAARTPWWYRAAPVAAALVVVVGIVSVLNRGGDGDADLGMVATESRQADTTQEATDGGDDLATLDAPEATSAPTEGDVGEAESSLADDANDEAMEEETEETTVLAASIQPAVDDFVSRVEEDGYTNAGTIEDGFECDLETSDPVRAVEPATIDGTDLWLVAFGDSSGVTSVNAYLRDDCTLAFVDARGS